MRPQFAAADLLRANFRPPGRWLRSIH